MAGVTDIVAENLMELESAGAHARDCIARIQQIADAEERAPDDFAYHVIERAKRLVNLELEIGRRSALRILQNHDSEEQANVATRELSESTNQLRRMTLYVQSQIFRLDPDSEHGNT